MIQYSLVKEILQGAWFLSPQSFIQHQQLAFGVLSGLDFLKEPEASNSLPFKIESNNDNINVDGNEKKFVAVTPLRGVMLKNDVECGQRGTRTIANRLLAADKDDSVAAHILLTESGGGATNAVPELSEAIEKLSKPIIQWIDGVSASAAMYVGSYCDEIIASRDIDIVGSIGTMIMFAGRPANSEHDGEKYIRLYADGSPDKNNEFEEALNNDNYKLIIENELNPHNDQFQKDIKANRPNVSDDQLTGKTYKAKDVIGSLIDSIGNFDFAVERAFALAEENKNFNFNNNQMKQFKAINGVLKVEELNSVDGAVSLNEEQLSQIDSALSASESLSTELKNATSAKEDAEKELATAKENAEAKEKELTAEIAELKKNAGASKPIAGKTTEGEESSDDMSSVMADALELAELVN